MNYSHLAITYANPADTTDTVSIKYKLRSNDFVDKWVVVLEDAMQKYDIDDPGRFYGFEAYEQTVKNAVTHINSLVDVINSYVQVTERKLLDIKDQDTLNYFHNIFEKYHGLLDKQSTSYWSKAPDSVRKALADLNLAVHRCESIAQGNPPRHVVTYYGYPKDNLLTDADYLLFEQVSKFGTVYLNYVEIGKTFEDLAADNDQYISDEAFRCPEHFSADFIVLFRATDLVKKQQHDVILKQYYDKHKEFFLSRNLQWGAPKLALGRIPLADIVDQENVIEQLSTRQWVKSVTLI